MKKIVYILLASMFLLTSCFEDEGNYKYENVNPPHWLINVNNPAPIVARQGSTAVFDASKYFVWDENAEKRAEEVTYEWVVNGKVIGEGLTFSIPTEELMAKAGIKDYSRDNGTFGTFNIVEKSTGVKYMSSIQVWCYSKYSADNWIILTDNNGQAGVSAIRQIYTYVDGVLNTDYELVKDAYAESNDGDKILGKPLSMNWAFDKHIGSQGSITIATDQAAYELDASSMKLYGMIDGDDFLDGVPEGFKMVARADCDGDSQAQPATFLASEDGQLYTRVMSKNYLGGKYLSEPYYIDEKGYRITKFGNSIYGGNPTIPCYDEKNRRIVMASVVTEQKTSPDGDKYFVSVTRVKPLTKKSYYVPVHNMPEGTEILYLGVTNYVPNNTRGCLHFVMVYNLKGESQTRVSEFAVYLSTSETNDGDYFSDSYKLENVPMLDKSSCILSSGMTPRLSNQASDMASKTVYYTVNNEIYYVKHSYMWTKTVDKFKLPNDVHITSKITYLALAYEYGEYLLVGCENGDVFLINISVFAAPRLEYKTNLGGKIISARQLGVRRATHDKFNI